MVFTGEDKILVRNLARSQRETGRATDLGTRLFLPPKNSSQVPQLPEASGLGNLTKEQLRFRF